MKPPRKIIAVIGLAGSGKTEVIDHIVATYGWQKVYFGQATFDEIARRGLGVNETNERLVREGLRAEFGPLVYAERIIEKIKALEGDGPVIVESLYSWEEYLRFIEVFGSRFNTIAIHASPHIRYGRLMARLKRPLTAKEAWTRDQSQIENLHQAGPIAMADRLVVNESTMDDLWARVDAIVTEINE